MEKPSAVKIEKERKMNKDVDERADGLSEANACSARLYSMKALKASY